MATTEERSVVGKRGTQSPARSATRIGIFAASGEYWTLGYGGTTFSLKDVKGLSYIQCLLQHPDEEFHALDLLSTPGTSDITRIERDESSLPTGVTLRRGLTGDAGEMLDARAKQEYKRKLNELNEELEDLRERGGHDRAEEIESEIESLKREVTRAVGIGGRDRRTGSTAERARLNVTRAIKGALQKITKQHASMGELLERTIKTGSFCSYAPDPCIKVDWQFYAGASEPPKQTAARELVILPRETSFLRAFTHGTVFVGRAAEHAILSSSLENALRGKGKTVLIGGLAGVGKTRMAAEIGAEALRRGMRAFVGSCYDRTIPLPFNPFVEILEEAVAQTRDLTAFRAALGSDASELAKLLPQLRRLFPDIPPASELPPEQSRRLLFRAISDMISRAARNAPILFVLDDLHWADEGTLLLLSHLAQLAPGIPFLIVGTYRDVDLDAAGELSRTLDELIRMRLVEHITLGGLSRDAVGEMLRALAGREPPGSVVQFFYSDTEGNPFFVEELFRHLVQQGKLLDSNGEFRRNFNIRDIDAPASMRWLVGLRMARLSGSTVKTLATAAAIGCSFTFQLLAASTHLDQDLLLDCVEEAERVGLISSTPQYPEARFRFSHELIRQAVIGRFSAARRQRLHLDIAAAIERLHPDTLEEVAGELAHHLWNAGSAADADKTVQFLAMAARRALEQSAYEAALRHLQNALDLLKKSPDSEDRARRELDLQIDHGAALLATKGWYVPEAGNAYGRAYELCRQLQENSRLFSVVSGLWSFHLVLGEHTRARSFAEQMVRLASSGEKDGIAVQAHWALGCSQFYMGEFKRAHASLESAIKGYDQRKHRTLAFRFGQDPCMSSLCYDALTLWTLGYAEQANQKVQRSLSLARELGHPFSIVWSLSNLAHYYSVGRDFVAAALHIEEGLRLASEYGFALYEETLLAHQLVGLAAQGKVDEFREASRRARKVSEIGYELDQPWYRSAFAEALAGLGKVDTALTLLAQAVEIMERTDEQYAESEIYRIKGEVLLKQIVARDREPPEIQPAECAAEQSFRSAIEAARKHGAKMLEMRASVSFSRLLIQSGRKAEAVSILKENYNWFTEGFDTADLRDAKALLDELSRRGA